MQRMMTPAARLAALLTAAAIGAGCGSSSNTPAEEGSTGAGTVVDGSMSKAALVELYDAYSMHVQEHGGSPKGLGDIEPYSIGLPFVYDGVRNGEIVAIWGADLNAAEPVIIGYETAVPTEGGQVVFSDGTIRELTAQEFESAPKGGDASA